MRFSIPAEDYTWQPVSKTAVIAWTIFYAAYMVHIFRAPMQGAGNLIEPVNFIMHESGHLLYSYTGSEFLHILGGTLFQIQVPLLISLGFAWRGHTTGTAFGLFFAFVNFFGIAVYMADARAQQLDLLTVGDPGDNPGVVMHDWWNIFNQLGLLQKDIQIANATRMLGWIGLAASVGWLWYMRSKYPAQDDVFFKSASA